MRRDYEKRTKINRNFIFNTIISNTSNIYIFPLMKTILYSLSFTDAKGQIVEIAASEHFYPLFTDSTFQEIILVN